MRLTVTTPPPAEPITLAEAKLSLRVDASDEDSFISALITAAREWVESATRRCLVQQSLRYSLPYFPTDRVFFLPRRFYDETLTDFVKPYYIELPKSSPLISVDSIKYYDTNNVQQTFDPSKYQAGADCIPARIDLVWGETWPQTYERPDAVQINYTAGYAPADEGSPSVTNYAANIPESLKHAIKLHVKQNYDPMSKDQYEQIGKSIESLIASYRVHTWEYGYPSP